MRVLGLLFCKESREGDDVSVNVLLPDRGGAISVSRRHFGQWFGIDGWMDEGTVSAVDGGFR